MKGCIHVPWELIVKSGFLVICRSYVICRVEVTDDRGILSQVRLLAPNTYLIRCIQITHHLVLPRKGSESFSKAFSCIFIVCDIWNFKVLDHITARIKEERQQRYCNSIKMPKRNNSHLWMAILTRHVADKYSTCSSGFLNKILN